MIRELIEGIQGYPGLFLFCALSGVAFPLPEDVTLLYAGLRVRSGELDWAPTLVVALLGVMVRDTLAYGAGRAFGDGLLSRPWVRRLLGEKKLDRARRMIEERGGSAILLGRFLIGVRATVFFASGAMGVSFRQFALYNAAGLLVTVPVVVVLGYEFGDPIVHGALWMIRRGRVVTLMILAIFAVSIWLRGQRDALERASAD